MADTTPKDWRRMLADLGGYENGLINIPAAGVIPIIDEVEKLRAKLDELEKQEPLAFVLQSIADGSIFKSVVAMVGWSSFKRDLNALETDPWVKAGRARIIPLYPAAC